MNDGKSRLDIAKEGYDIDGQKYSVKFNVVPNIGIMDGIEQGVKFSLTVNSMSISVGRISHLEIHVKSGMTSVVAGKISLCMTTLRMVLMDLDILQWR